MSKNMTEENKTCWHSKIIPMSSIPNIENFKYRGEDRSYFYVYVLSPIADEIANLLPMWLAPNIITVFGFSLNIIAHLTLLYYQGLQMEGYIPSWAILMTGIFYLIYVELDNTDGKQARRTHSSSVLGMLLDHGCDGFNSFIATINIGRIMQIGNSPFSILIITIVSGSFYFATLESYYIGGVYLPEINAVSDGAIVYLATWVAAIILGPEFLKSKVVYDLKVSEWCAIVCCGFAVVFWSLNLYEIFFRKDRIREYNFNDVFLATIYFIIVTVSMAIFPYYTPGDIFSTPVIVLYIYSFLLIRPVAIMQLYLVTGQNLTIWK